MRPIFPFLLVVLITGCSGEERDTRQTDDQNTSGSPAELMLGESLFRSIDFTTPVDTLKKLPAFTSAGPRLFELRDTVRGNLIHSSILHDGQHLESIDVEITPGENADLLFSSVKKELDSRYGKGKGKKPYAVWIVDHKGKPLVELSLEIIGGKSGKKLKITYFLRQYI